MSGQRGRLSLVRKGLGFSSLVLLERHCTLPTKRYLTLVTIFSKAQTAVKVCSTYLPAVPRLKGHLLKALQKEGVARTCELAQVVGNGRHCIITTCCRLPHQRKHKQWLHA